MVDHCIYCSYKKAKSKQMFVVLKFFFPVNVVFEINFHCVFESGLELTV